VPALNVPGWALYTITAAACFGGGVWSASRVFSGVENKADKAAEVSSEARSDVAALAPRVAALEIRDAAVKATMEALSKKQDEMSADIKELLKRTPK
jgi:hypothetical protein